MAFDFNWAPTKLDLQMKGIQTPVQQPAPQQSQVMKDYMDAERLGGWNMPQAPQQQVPQQTETAVQRMNQIANLQAQIKELEASIAEKQSKLQNWSGNIEKIAAMDARRLLNNDPTSMYRWKKAQDYQKQVRAEDMKRIQAEKDKNEARNKLMNQYKIESILKGAIPFNARSRDELMMMEKSLNTAEELAKQYNDVDMLKQIDERRNALQGYEPVSDKSSRIESDFIRELSMVGKVGGRTKEQFVSYVNDLLDNNPDVWRYNPGLQQKLYQAIGKNTKNVGKPQPPQE